MLSLSTFQEAIYMKISTAANLYLSLGIIFILIANYVDVIDAYSIYPTRIGVFFCIFSVFYLLFVPKYGDQSIKKMWKLTKDKQEKNLFDRVWLASPFIMGGIAGFLVYW